MRAVAGQKPACAFKPQYLRDSVVDYHWRRVYQSGLNNA